MFPQNRQRRLEVPEGDRAEPVPALTPADLRGRLREALVFAAQAVERFARDGYTDLDNPENTISRGKLIAETGALLFTAAPVALQDGIQFHVEKVARLLAPHARSAEVLVGVCLQPALALDHAAAHICLTQLGYADPAFDRLLRKSMSAMGGDYPERFPHRVLEQRWLANLFGRGDTQAAPSSVRRRVRSALDSPMNLFGATTHDLYAFTHAVMYATEFGTRSNRLPRARAQILAEAERALARCLDEQDYDLVAELLLTWPLTRARWSPGAVFGFRVLTSVQDRAGFLPTPATRLGTLKKLKGEQRKDYLLATSYHATYMMGFLAACALRPGRAPPPTIRSDRAGTHADRQLWSFLETSNLPHWQQESRRLADSERHALLLFFFTIALWRKIKERDFQALYHLVHFGVSLGFHRQPAVRQATELLERVVDASRISTLWH